MEKKVRDSIAFSGPIYERLAEDVSEDEKFSIKLHFWPLKAFSGLFLMNLTLDFSVCFGRKEKKAKVDQTFCQSNGERRRRRCRRSL
jgi:hypothetical protein